MAAVPMVHLTSVGGSFHGRVLMARLGSEGILAELRGAIDGVYPTGGAVEVFVSAEQAEAARQVLLADAVDACFQEAPADPERRSRGRRMGQVWLLMAALVILTVMATARAF